MHALRSWIALAALGLAPACGGGGGGSGTVVVSGDPVGDTVAEGQDHGVDLANFSIDELVGLDTFTQVSITASILAAMNDGAALQADFALQVVSEGDIIALASDEVTDHDAANVELDGVVRAYGVSYAPSGVASQILSEANANVGSLRGSRDPDFDYVDLQVREHAAQQVVLDRLYAIVGFGAMGTFLLDMKAQTDAHLAAGTDILATFY